MVFTIERLCCRAYENIEASEVIYRSYIYLDILYYPLIWIFESKASNIWLVSKNPKRINVGISRTAKASVSFSVALDQRNLLLSFGAPHLTSALSN